MIGNKRYHFVMVLLSSSFRAISMNQCLVGMLHIYFADELIQFRNKSLRKIIPALRCRSFEVRTSNHLFHGNFGLHI